ncbi:MAG: flippase-like domain-containing protein [Chloroflexi bacterium]|nr:flippase-like domain-containing protein [Chloroflexota bacterium]MCL5108155.1 flippase-like domain-containing protein [Chloroflexota bacterium]
MKANWRLWLGIGLSLVCLCLVVRGIDPDEVRTALSGVNYFWLFPSAAAGVVSVWFKALRWRLLFLPRTGLRTGKLFSITMIGYVINSVLPARLGDPARAVLVGEMGGAPTAQALATVVIERLLDVLTLLVFLVALMPFIGMPDWLWRSAFVVGLAAVGGFVGLLLIGRRRDRLVPALTRLLRPLPVLGSGAIAKQLDHLLSGMDAFGSPGNSAMIAFYCLVIWVLSVSQNYFVQLGFALPVPATAAVLVCIVNVLGMLIPSSPGYIGVFHYLTVLTLGLFAVDPSVALSYAIVLHLTIFVPLVAAGLLALWRESLSFAKVSARAARLEQ